MPIQWGGSRIVNFGVEVTPSDKAIEEQLKQVDLSDISATSVPPEDD